MATAKAVLPFSSWQLPMGGFEIKFSNEEVRQISDAADPAAAILTFIPEIGPVLAAAIVVSWWIIRKIAEAHPNMGIEFLIGPPSFYPMIVPTW